MEYIYDYITRREYECPHCNALPPDIKPNYLPIFYEIFFDKWKRLREEWGRAIRIGPPGGGGGYRCAYYNRMIGGTYLSAHLFGAALDPDLNTVDEVDKFAELVEQMFPELRMGIYTKTGTFVHIDQAFLIRPRSSESWIEGVRWKK